MNEYFLPNDIARCSNESCLKKLKCARYLDALPFETYWYSEFRGPNCEYFIEKEVHIKKMTYKRVAKKKPDLSKNPDKVDTEIGKTYLKQGKVRILKRGETRNN